MKSAILTTFLMCGMIALTAGVGSAASLNEIRIDQPSTDNDEYVEIFGTSGESLNDLTLIVIGDGTGASGVIESVVSLAGQSVPSDGYFLVAESTITLASADLTTSLNFENSDNVTFMLVQNFSGSNGADLDTNDDGVLDTTPWTAIVDLIALIEEDNPPAGTEYHYGPPTIGPDGTFVPGHVFREGDAPGSWKIGIFDPALGVDTPGAPNITAAALIGAGALGGSIVALFNDDPGGVTELDFTLTGSQSLSFTGISGSGTQRVLTPSAALVGDSVVDNLAVAGTATTNAGNVDFYIYPAISDIQNGTIPTLAQASVTGIVTGVRTGTAEGGGQEYSIADAAGAWNGIMIEDPANTPAIGDSVDVAGQVQENFGCTQIFAVGYLNNGAGTPIAPTVITAADFQHTTATDTLPNEQYEGVLVQIDGLSNAQDNGFGETIFDDNVALDGLFYDARGQGDITDGNDYDVVGIGYFSFSDWKILPRGSSDLAEIGDTSPPGIALAFATGSGVDEISVLFNEAVDQTTAETVGNYELFASPSTSLGNPTSATLLTSGVPVNRAVALTFTAGTIVDQSVYFVRVNNVQDTKGNGITSPIDSNDLYGGVQSIAWAGEESNDVTVRDPNICVTVTGTLTSVNDFGSAEIYVQDDTGGIQDRDFGVDYTIDTLEPDDQILAAGFVNQYNGKPQLDDDAATGAWDPVTAEISDETGSVAPRIVSVSQLGEDTENELIVIFGVTIDPGSDTNFAGTRGYGISDSSGSGILWVDAQTNLVGEAIPTDPVTLRGIGLQYNGGSPNTGYEIGPRTTDDLDPEFSEAETSVGIWEIYR